MALARPTSASHLIQTQKMLGLRCRYLLPSDSQRSQPPSRVPQLVIPGPFCSVCIRAEVVWR
eukprot:1174411-Pyramimonas_sp.AAC.1